MRDLSDDQLERYARHIVLPDIGGAGQQKLLAARVLVVGAGGLGSPCLQYLAAAGVGTIGIVDDDRVSLSNLQRQTLFRTADVGQLKVHCAVRELSALNPDIEFVPHAVRLTAANAEAMISQYDIVADGSDSFETRFAVDAACRILRKALVSAAVGQFDGQLCTFKGYLPDQPCYRCFVPDMPKLEPGSCARDGIIGALAGVMGALQAVETIREITGFGAAPGGQLLLYDALSARMRTLALGKDPQCVHCAHG